MKIPTQHIIEGIEATAWAAGGPCPFIQFDFREGFIAATDQYQLRAFAVPRFDIDTFQVGLDEVPALLAACVGSDMISMDAVVDHADVITLQPFPKYIQTLEGFRGKPPAETYDQAELNAGLYQDYRDTLDADPVMIKEPYPAPFVFRDGFNWYFLSPLSRKGER